MPFAFASVLGIYLVWSLCTGTLHGTRHGRSSGIARIYRSETPTQYWAAFIWICIIDGIFFVAAVRHHNRPRNKAINSNLTIRSPATTSASAPVMTEMVEDQHIAARLSKRIAWLMEGRDWETSPGFRKQDRPVARLIDQMYNSGAPTVYVDMLDDGRADPTARLLTIDIELPGAAEQRQACFNAVAEFQKTNPECFISPNLPTTARYLEMRIPR